MRVLLIARAKIPAPPEHLPAMVQAFVDWRERYRDKMESFEFFAAANGGFGVFNAPDEATLSQIMMEWPFAPFSDLELTPIVDGDTALKQWQAAVQAMTGGLS